MPDTCDRCTAHPLHQATRGGHTLLFCGHHLRANVDALMDSGWDVSEIVAQVSEYVAV